MKRVQVRWWAAARAAVRRCWLAACLYLVLLVASYLVLGRAATLLLFLLFVLGGLYGAQDRLLYHPDPESLDSRSAVQAPSVFQLPFENIFIRSGDGTPLHLYLIKQPPERLASAPTLVFLHGNAGNMGHRLQNAAGLYVTVGCNVLMLEYRGYGLSGGSPSETGLCLDAQAALDFLMTRPDIDHSQIIVFGRSLGGAVAIDLAARPEYSSRIWCLILENTFTSIPDMAHTLFGWRLLRYVPLCCYKNQFLSEAKVRCVRNPTLFVSGLNDGLVPPHMMTELYRNCGSADKHLVQVRQGGHNDTWTCPQYYHHITKFLESALPHRPPPPPHVSVVTNV